MLVNKQKQNSINNVKGRLTLAHCEMETNQPNQANWRTYARERLISFRSGDMEFETCSTKKKKFQKIHINILELLVEK